MVKCENGRIVLEGNANQIVSETTLLLNALHDVLLRKVGKEETELHMKFIFENYRKTEAQLDEAISDIRKEIMNLLFGKEERK